MDIKKGIALLKRQIKPKANPRAYEKLNLGCGYDYREGYLNVDMLWFVNPDILGDFRSLPNLPSNFYKEIIAQDCLEHIPRCDSKPTLREWHRLLAPNGVLKIRVPNLPGLLTLFNREDQQTLAAQENLIQCLFGTQALEGDWHLSGFSEMVLRSYLEEIGFDRIQFESMHDWLFNVTCYKKAS
ncbi:MAG: hypothetical protein MUC48_20745 [Leptolyngbya sp. Prado105]|jgi:SAM-dependent methyltransferase|nr:hypothetical protein [Leptolyngbya sp. Prado105]